MTERKTADVPGVSRRWRIGYESPVDGRTARATVVEEFLTTDHPIWGPARWVTHAEADDMTADLAVWTR